MFGQADKPCIRCADAITNCVLDKKGLDFAVFCIENVAERLNLKGSDIYSLLAEKSKILDEYIISNYEPLHTQCKEYIVDDIIECMSSKGLLE